MDPAASIEYGNLISGAAPMKCRSHSPRNFQEPLSFRRGRNGSGAPPFRVFSQHQRAARLFLRRISTPRATSSPWATTCPFIWARCPCRSRQRSARLKLGPGDVALLNDPYAGGTHLPDLTMVMPVFAARSPAAAVLHRQSRAPRRYRRRARGLDGPFARNI